MSFGGFGGFGSNNNNNNNQQPQNTGFGGFGSNNNNTGFGQQQNTGFGATNNTSGSLFGSGGTGFGSTGSTGFGASKPAFGASNTSGGGLFGSTTSTTGTGFGGFGSAANTTNNASTPFGGGTTGGLFGASKPAFGAGTATGGGLFGGSSGGSSFGQTNTSSTGAFGAPASTALGGGVAQSQGTGTTPFQAHTEKEPNSQQTNHYQSISFMGPYNMFSFEELRLADYNQGRRFGNASNQPGAFGTSTGFGGFGGQTQTGGTGFGNSTGSGLFGAQATTSASPFGSTTQTTGGFGSTGTGLFGAQKPAGTGLFGSGAAATSSQSTGGLFGTSNQSGFGNQQNTGFGASSTGGGLFGSTQQQQKPAGGFSFGASAPTGTSGFGGGSGGFGTSSGTTGGGLFGSTPNQGSSLFGGQQQQQQNNTNPFGSNTGQTGFGGFGSNNQQKPASLFGNNTTSTTGGGLFGNTNNNNNTSQPQANPFGSNTNQGNGNSLFGSKPAATGTGTSLFGNTNNAGNTGGGLFGGFGNTNQNQATQGNSLFGNNSQAQQKPGGLFGNTNTSGGLFGNTNNNQQSGGLGLGSLTNNQGSQLGGLFGGNPVPTLGSSSLWNGNQASTLNPPQGLSASIFDRNPYGSSSIFSGLPPPPQTSPGPIATPISAGQKAKKHAALPQYKINPTMASRLVTPQKRGFGFTYSTYGTPSSASSNVSTPGGFGGSLLGNSIGRSLGKSYSTSNLRRTFDNDAESILSPGAFSAGSNRFNGSGSLKRLTIDRSLRSDLFGNDAIASLPSSEANSTSRQPSIVKKKVSFDTNTLGGNGNGVSSTGVVDGVSDVREQSATPTAQEQGFLRSPRPNGTGAQPEIQITKGKELAVVIEDGSLDALERHDSADRTSDQRDPQPGRYYMKPSREELRKLPREQLKKVSKFQIGRERCGHVEFDQPVDLTTVDLDNIFDNICVIVVRSLTVYPQSDKKPSVGKGLNVPSTVTLKNSWPRMKDRRTPTYEKNGARFNKHVQRLRMVKNTQFVQYDRDNGEWVFRVEHFTTYALDYDDDASEGDSLQASLLSELSDTPTPKSRTSKAQFTPMVHDTEMRSSFLSEQPSQASSGPDDTFDFRKKRLLPGAFDGSLAIEDDQEIDVEENIDPFLEERSVISQSESDGDEPSDISEGPADVGDRSLMIQEKEMALVGSFPQTADDDDDVLSALKPSQYDTPEKLVVRMGDDWAEQLQRTMSPRKLDRQTLKDDQAYLFKEIDDNNEDTPREAKIVRDRAGFATSIDLMNSLFGKEELRKSGRGINKSEKAKGLKWPYSKRPSDDNDHMDLTDNDRDFHNSFKPKWGPGNNLLYRKRSELATRKRQFIAKESITNEGIFGSKGYEIQLILYPSLSNITPECLERQLARSRIFVVDGVPAAKTQSLPFDTMFRNATDIEDQHERAVWQLASILFDELSDEFTSNIPPSQVSAWEHRIRKDRLSKFWSQLCYERGHAAVSVASTAEDRAISHLSKNSVVEACNTLIDGKDYRLATLVSQIGGDEVMRVHMVKQIKSWRELNALSEMTDSIRALYEMLAGNTCVCEGKTGVLEDRASTFVISERFNLDWKRAFGLKLWYGILPEEPVEVAVNLFAADLKHREGKRPLPNFIEEGVNLPASDDHPREREDLLWGMLKLYAESKSAEAITKLIDVVMPQNATGNPLDARLPFEVYHTLALRYPTQKETVRSDQLGWDFATQLEAKGEWTWAIFPLLYLSDHDQRREALQDLLARHAPSLNELDSEQFTLLTKTFCIPENWIWAAKALYARSVLQDHVAEVGYILRAHNWEEAHNTLCRTVAPQAIIEQDWTTLQKLLEGFVSDNVGSDWDRGGQVYGDYVRLMKGSASKEKTSILKRLSVSLPAMVQARRGKLGFLEEVAIQEMSEVVGRMALADTQNKFEAATILRLPLAENAQLKHTTDLSLHYYRAHMAAT